MFEKGKSGNPGGRPKDPLVKKVRELALQACPRAIERLIEIMDKGEDKYSIQAANSLLDRGIGRASIATDSEAGQIKVIVVNRDGVLDVVRDDGAS